MENAMKELSVEEPLGQSPGISVVTPTHGRVDLVEQLLATLEVARRAYAGETEVLIIDSSPAPACARIKEASRKSGAYYHAMPNNVRSKRNWGTEHARYPIVLYVDSDCAVDANLLAEHARFYANDGGRKVGGVVGLTRFVGEENWVWQVIQRTSTLDAFSYPEHHDVVPWGPTCNMSYLRRVVEEVGLFDTSFPFALGGDDVDLGLRVTDAGYSLCTNARAVVEHERRTWNSISAIVGRRFRWGRMHFYLMRKYARRVSSNPPSVAGLFLLLLLLFLPFAFVRGFAAWAVLPFFWLVTEQVMEALLISHGGGRQPAEFLYTLCAGALGLIFQAGALLEGFRNRSLDPLFKEVNYCPPSPVGRRRGMAQHWAKPLALFLSVWLILILELLLRAL